MERLRSPLARPARAARRLPAVIGGRASRAALCGLRDDVQAPVALFTNLDHRAREGDALLHLMQELVP